MARNVTKIRVFIASPGDTIEERKAASEVVEELNKINTSDNIELELIKWETHTYSGIGEDAQEVINRQINDDYDIFVGLMWKRFGNPTKRADSGTEEEFLRALEIHKSKARPIKIMFYFNQTPIPPKEIDIKQIQKINEFKEKLQQFGVYHWDYSTVKQFEGLLRVQVSKSAKELIDELKIEKTDLVKVENNQEEDEPGLFDLIEHATDDFVEIQSILERMTELMTDLGEKTNKRAAELNSIDKRTTKPQELKRLIDKAANDMQVYVKRMETEMPLFKDAMINGFDSLTKAYSIYYTDWRDISKEEEDSFKSLEELMGSMSQFRDAMHNLRTKILTLPRATTSFNKAKRDTDRIIKGLITEVDSALTQIQEIKRMRGQE